MLINSHGSSSQVSCSRWKKKTNNFILTCIQFFYGQYVVLRVWWSKNVNKQLYMFSAEENR